jgi:hypothetical protein
VAHAKPTRTATTSPDRLAADQPSTPPSPAVVRGLARLLEDDTGLTPLQRSARELRHKVYNLFYQIMRVEESGQLGPNRRLLIDAAWAELTDVSEGVPALLFHTVVDDLMESLKKTGGDGHGR